VLTKDKIMEKELTIYELFFLYYSKRQKLITRLEAHDYTGNDLPFIEKEIEWLAQTITNIRMVIDSMQYEDNE